MTVATNIKRDQIKAAFQEWEKNSTPRPKVHPISEIHPERTHTLEFRQYGKAIALIDWDADGIIITLLETLDPGGGGPKQLVEFLKSLADKYQIQIWGYARKYDPDPPIPTGPLLDLEQILDFYKRRGFELTYIDEKSSKFVYYPKRFDYCNASKRKKSKFPNSKRVEFAAALGLVVWVWSEMMETHDSSKLCVQWLIIVIFYCPVCYYVSKWLDNSRIGYVLFVTLSLMTAAAAYRNTFYPAFSIVPRQQYVEMKTPRHFLKWNMSGREILSPINVIMLAQFTNLRDEGMVINSYQFEGQTTNNTWEIMPTIDIKMGSMISFAGTNWGKQGWGILLGPVKEGEVFTAYFGDDVFPEAFCNKTITSGGTVTGIIFLEGTKHGFDGIIRCRVRDTVDREFVELVSPLKERNFLNTWIPLISNPGPMPSPESENIKKLPVVPWSQEWH